MKRAKYLSEIILMRPSQEDWQTLAADPEKGCENLRVLCGDVAETLKEAAQMTAQQLDRLSNPNSEWAGYMAIDKRTSQVVGVCGFKGPPDVNGVVELAYYTFPPFEGLGCATLMVSELVAHALSRPAVKSVIAHTLPEENASARVLSKCGFDCMGVFEDVEDGKVWRWEMVDPTKLEDS